MFYFGGMTLGYLTPPNRDTGEKDGETVANVRQAQTSQDHAPSIRDGRSLIARANWFGLFW